MKNPLRKRIKRELRDNLGKYLAIAILLIAVMANSAMFVISDSIESAYDNNFEKLHIEDGHYIVKEPINDETVKALEEIGVNSYQDYYKEAEYKDSVVRIYTVREYVNQQLLFDGELPQAANEIALDRLYAKNNEIKIGDDISIGSDTFHVCGYAAMADYSSMFKSNSDIMMDAFHFGVGIVTAETFEAMNESTIYDYAYLTTDRNLSLKEEKELSKDIVECLMTHGAELTSLCIAEENPCIKFIKDDIGSDVPMIRVLLILIIIIIAFVFAIFTKTTIEDESAIIGTLLSSGYTRREILMHYLEAPMLVTIVSAIIGNAIGYTVMLEPYKSLFYTSYSLPPCEIKFSTEAFLLTTVLPIVIMIVINIAALCYKLRLTPLQFLRRELGRKKNRKAAKLPNTSFLNRFHLRVIIQNKNNYFLLFIGVFMASTLLLFGLDMKPMIDNYLEDMDDNLLANYQYILKYPVELEETDAEKFNIASLQTYYKAADKNLEVSVYGMKEDSAFLHDVDLTKGSNHIYIASGLRHKMGLKLGDTISMDDPYTEKTYEFEIFGDYEYPAGFALFMNIDEFNEIFDKEEGSYRGYFSNEELTIDKAYTANVITVDDINSLGKQMMQSFNGMIPIIVILSLLIYFVFMYILTKVVIDKNALFISYMKVFGYEDKEINKLYLRTTTIIVLCSLIVCVPLEVLAVDKCFQLAMVKVNGYIDLYSPASLLAAIVAIGIVTYFIINFFHIRRIRKINMVSALKARE